MKTRERLVEKCRLLMSDNGWWTIPGMAAALKCSQTGAAARIRDLRKPRYGGFKVVKRPYGGAFEYKLHSEKEITYG